MRCDASQGRLSFTSDVAELEAAAVTAETLVVTLRCTPPTAKASLCYATLCDALRCVAMLCYAMLCCAVLCCAVLCYVMICYALPCYAMRCCHRRASDQQSIGAVLHQDERKGFIDESTPGA